MPGAVVSPQVTDSYLIRVELGHWRTGVFGRGDVRLADTRVRPADTSLSSGVDAQVNRHGPRFLLRAVGIPAKTDGIPPGGPVSAIWRSARQCLIPVTGGRRRQSRLQRY